MHLPPRPRAPHNPPTRHVVGGGQVHGRACRRGRRLHAPGAPTEQLVEPPNLWCHCQIGARATRGAIDACGRVTGAGDEVWAVGRVGASRVHTCSRGCRMGATVVETLPFLKAPIRNCSGAQGHMRREQCTSIHLVQRRAAYVRTRAQRTCKGEAAHERPWAVAARARLKPICRKNRGAHRVLAKPPRKFSRRRIEAHASRDGDRGERRWASREAHESSMASESERGRHQRGARRRSRGSGSVGKPILRDLIGRKTACPAALIKP